MLASAAAVDADIVVELIVDDAVAVDDETVQPKKKNRNYGICKELASIL